MRHPPAVTCLAVIIAPEPELGHGKVARAMRGALAVIIGAALITAYQSINFFFYFTVLSNILAAVLMAILAVSPVRTIDNGLLRGGVTLYMTITGLVYAVLLRPIEADVGLTEPWVNWVLHSLGPATVMIDWLLFPPHKWLSRTALWYWLIFPALFLAVTLIRGPVVDFYPYPFLDPREIGYPGVAAYSAGILLGFLVIGAFIRWWGNERGQQLAPGAL
jgi:hypothetical protein